MIRFLLLTALCILPVAALAQTASKQPLEVTAQKALEWDRNNKTFTAREKAIAKQGTTELHGDLLTAKYTEGKGGTGGMTVNRIDATGNVQIISEGSVATGQKGYYLVKDGFAELTGNNLKLVTDTDTVTARDKMTYSATRREMNAYGNARATQGDDTIAADRLIGRFKPVNGKNEMDEMEAIGNVVVTTPTDVLYGDRAIYLAGTNKATVTGNVRIERGPNLITGARGEIDLDTNVSKIFGDGGPTATSTDGTQTGSDGRVRGVFYADE